MADVAKKKALWRPWLRAVHRDVGYVAVGLTFIYALSGLAVNHITDWSGGDANFKRYAKTYEYGPLEGDATTVMEGLRKRIGITEKPRDVFPASEDDLEIVFDKRTLHVNPKTGHVVEEGQKPRFLLRIANWLHVTRGKKAWNIIADAYAGGLMLLAVSGIFMIAGKRGIIGRGAILVSLGIAIPVAYVVLSGGP